MSAKQQLRAAIDEPALIQADRDGVLRLAGTRVTLDTIVGAFERGATAEEIVQRYPVLHLSDVYAVIGYYLRHQSEVGTYLERRQQEAAKVRQENQRRFGSWRGGSRGDVHHDDAVRI